MDDVQLSLRRTAVSLRRASEAIAVIDGDTVAWAILHAAFADASGVLERLDDHGEQYALNLDEPLRFS